MKTWLTYKRLLEEYAFRYKFKLFIGLLAGFLAGSSIFGILFQLQGVLAPFSGDLKKPSKQLITVKNGDKTREIVVESFDVKSKENVVFNDQDIIVKNEVYNDMVTDKIPAMIYNILAKFGIERDEILKNQNQVVMLLSMFSLFLFFIFKATTTFVNRYYMQWVGLRVVTDLRHELFRHIVKQSFTFHNKNDAGELMSKVTNDTAAVQVAISNTIAVITRAPVELFFSMSYIIYITVRLELYSLFFLMFIGMPCSLIGIVLLGRKMKKHVKKVFDQIALVISHMYEILSCIRVVKAYHTEDKESKNFTRLSENFFKSSIKVMKYEIAMTPLMELIGVVCICLFLFICYLKGTPLDVVFPICIAANMAYAPLKQLSRINVQLNNTTVACDRIFGLLDTEVVLKEDPQSKSFQKFKDNISFNQVSFAYSEKSVLKGISLTIERGQFVAFVGEAGSGKSSIVNLLCRFYDVSEGTIKIDGVDIRHLNVQALRDRVAFVDQVSLLFNTSIRDNIAYGNEDASEEEIIKVAKLASADDFITANEEGYDFIVGEKGIKLSGGQRQRVAIARSLLKKADILVLDEATSSLDSVTEKQVQVAIDGLIGHQTLIVIAHRLPTIQKADKIFVIGNGCLLDSGTHEELVSRVGSYQNMWKIQFDGGQKQ